MDAFLVFVAYYVASRTPLLFWKARGYDAEIKSACFVPGIGDVLLIGLCVGATSEWCHARRARDRTN